MRIIAALLFSLILSASACSAKDTHSQKQNLDELNELLDGVAGWQIDNFEYSKEKNLHDYGIDSWANSVFYIGLSEWSKVTGNTSYDEWLNKIGSENNWNIPANFKDFPKYSLYHADELCVGQFYLDMYDKYKDGKMLESTKERLDWIMSNPPADSMSYRNKQVWSWCDALFMAPPVYLRMAVIEKDNKYLDYMDSQFKKTYAHLYDSEAKLFFRDDSYFNKREQNGEKVFWGRGNGWVIAGIARTLKYLPKDSSYRPFYEELFQDLGARLATFQSPDGFWHASLLDPASYPSPETSATGLITYALAYGVNEGLLQKEEYFPVVQKGWEALTSSVNEEGKLGWVQPIGADPKKVTKDMTAAYGPGAFLLAGVEMYKMTENQID